jgi:exopolysaccharide biosynthesis polyprenyl glycosylphosphotransferase
MLNQQSKQLAYVVALIDAAVLCAVFFLAFGARSTWLSGLAGMDPNRPDLSVHLWVLFLCVPAFWVLAYQSGLYEGFRNRSPLNMLRRTVAPFFYLGAVLGTLIFILHATSFSRAVFVLFMTLSFFGIVAVRVVARLWLARQRGEAYFQRRLLIVGTSADALALGRQVRDHGEHDHILTGHLAAPGEPADEGDEEVLGTLADLKQIVERKVIDEVIFAVPATRLTQCQQEIAWCEEVGVTVHLRLDFVRTLFAKMYPTHWDGVPLLTISPTPNGALELLVKRALDLTVSGIGLLVFGPLLLAIAAIIKLTSKGPAIFSQPRVGLNGREFAFYKFRSMYADAEERKAALAKMNEMSGPVFKIKNDPRITPIGRTLRKFSLDELPQLWNVFKGEMSLVGPRPPVPQEVVEYERWQRRRLSMKPGITCLWQVNGRNHIGFDEWMQLDLDYIDNWSLRLDFEILLRTIPAVITARGAH